MFGDDGGTDESSGAEGLWLSAMHHRHTNQYPSLIDMLCSVPSHSNRRSR